MSLCQVCGVLLELKATGRKPKHCPTCREKQRKEYQRQQYLKRTPNILSDVERTKRKIRRERRFIRHHLATRRGSRSSLGVLKGYDHTQTIKEHRNIMSYPGWPVGGSGYDAVLKVPEHLRPRRQVLKVTHEILNIQLKQLLFESWLRHGFTMPRKRGVRDPWAWYAQEFYRRFKERGFC
jgi:hypothetical protein